MIRECERANVIYYSLSVESNILEQVTSSPIKLNCYHIVYLMIIESHIVEDILITHGFDFN